MPHQRQGYAVDVHLTIGPSRGPLGGTLLQTQAEAEAPRSGFQSVHWKIRTPLSKRH